MVGKLSFLMTLLLGCLVWAQEGSNPEAATIERVKGLRVSSLDRDLPEVTLEFFLKYEAGGVPIRWGTSNCTQPKNSLFTQDAEAGTCVEAQLDLKDSRSATVVVFMGTAKSGRVPVPKILRVTVIDRGAIHEVQRLHDLPMELHRPLPKGPRDLPLPVG